MFFVYLGLYLLFLLVIWGFFIVARIHAFKFKNFSHNIQRVTNFLFVFLLLLSIVGIAIIYMYSGMGSTFKINMKNTDSLKEVYY